MKLSLKKRCAIIAAFLCLALGLARAAAPQPDFTAELTDQAIDQRIQQYRTAQAELTLTGADGKPLAGTTVTVRQTRHKFLFGCNAFGLRPADSSQPELDYQKRLSDLMNYVTLPFYWASFEPIKGQPQTERLRAQAEWCKAHGIATKGHPLCWTNNPAPWLRSLEVGELHRLQIDRIRRDVGAFAGLINRWDVVNEATTLGGDRPGQDNPIKRLFQGVGTVPLIKETFDTARQTNPGATLILNDYKKGEDFRKLVEDSLRAGVPVGTIGIQSHMHGKVWAPREVWATCERFKGFGLPLHFTEVTILSGPYKEDPAVRLGGRPRQVWPTTPQGEKTQAEQVARFYRILFSHPAVQAITWWDLSDRGAWKNAPAGLVRADMTPKPAYEALLKLVKGAWWTGETRLTADAQGRVHFRGFLGDYALETPQGKASFKLDKAGEAKVEVKLN